MNRKNGVIAVLLCSMMICLSGCGGEDTLMSEASIPEEKPVIYEATQETEIPAIVTYSEVEEESTATYEPPAQRREPDGFCYVAGEELFDGEGNPYRIKGICFGNNVWANPGQPTLTHHDEESYAEIAALGFNTVRFYINYNIFESDETPYQYKESGFAWLDENIQWAKKHNIKLILNMHVPQGGFISASQVGFWEEEQNVERYMALWCEIADRYAQEQTILGYGLLNEPFVPVMDTVNASLELYYDMIERLITKLRAVDEKHVLFVERPYGIVSDNGTTNYAWGDIGSAQKVSHENVMYEFHFYDYTNFTSQGISWGSFESDWYYGDDRIALLSGERQYLAVCQAESAAIYEEEGGDWQYVESPLLTVSEYPEADAGYVVMDFSGLTKDALVYVDDIVVQEYGSDDQWIRTIYQYSFDNTTACSGWDMGDATGGKCVYTDSQGHDAKGCELISEAGGRYRIYKNESMYNYFPLKEGRKYQVGFWIKVEGGENVKVQPGLQVVAAEKVFALNEEFLEHRLLTFVNWGRENKVPIYIGEFGTTSHIMGNDFGGEKWVADVLDIFNQYDLSYSYHDYHEENYGLYTTPSTQERDDINEVLYQVFEEKVKE